MTTQNGGRETGPLTVTEAAASLGLSRSTLLHQIKNGAIKAQRVGPLWTITEKEVERYRTTSLGKRGRAVPK